MLPFTTEQFFDLFATYNDAIWPAQTAAYFLGAVAMFLLFARTEASDRIITAILAIMWAWTGLGYHLAFFTTINSAAYLFGALSSFRRVHLPMQASSTIELFSAFARVRPDGSALLS
ncbi:DUF6064 family protein [Bradyrhizobium sp. UFLA05-112]